MTVTADGLWMELSRFDGVDDATFDNLKLPPHLRGELRVLDAGITNFGRVRSFRWAWKARNTDMFNRIFVHEFNVSELVLNANAPVVLATISQAVTDSYGVLPTDRNSGYLEEHCRALGVNRKDLEVILDKKALLLGAACSWCDLYIAPYTTNLGDLVAQFRIHSCPR